MPVPTSAQMQTSIETFYADQQKLHSLVNGSNTTDVVVDTGTLPSWSKFLLTMGALPSNTYTGLGTAYASDFTVTTSEAGQLMELAGNTLQKTITFGAPAGYANTHFNILVNNSGRGWKIAISGQATRLLWPGNALIVQKMGAGSPWKTISMGKRYNLPGGATTFYVNHSTGSDTFGDNDGLSTTNALQTVNGALYFLLNEFEFNSLSQSTVTISMGATDTTGVHYAPSGGQLGRQGGAAIVIDGNGFGLQPATGTAFQGYYAGCVLQIRNCFFQSTNAQNIELDWGARIELQGSIHFIGSGTHVADIYVRNKSHVTFRKNYQITGSRSYHFVNDGGIIEFASDQVSGSTPVPITATINNGMAVSNWVLNLRHGKTTIGSDTIWTNANTVSGPKFSNTECSVLTGTVPTSGTFPGTTSGSTDGTSSTA